MMKTRHKITVEKGGKSEKSVRGWGDGENIVKERPTRRYSRNTKQKIKREDE